MNLILSCFVIKLFKNGAANVGAVLVLKAACDDDHRWTWYKKWKNKTQTKVDDP